MGEPAYIYFEGIEGSCTQEGREGSCEVLAVDHQVNIPSDEKDATATGTRVYQPLVITKEIDKASVLLLECVARSKSIPRVRLEFWRTDETGTQMNYYNIQLEGVRITGVKTELLNVQYPENGPIKAREKVAIRYDKITWVWTDGNLAFTDEWRRPNV
jgi:type VI secretion system secreted protein Hcp